VSYIRLHPLESLIVTPSFALVGAVLRGYMNVVTVSAQNCGERFESRSIAQHRACVIDSDANNHSVTPFDEGE
jgi:hypothetical protein